MTIFHKILSGSIPAAKIYEDEQVFAFMDAFPQSLGHALIIAKNGSADIFDMPAESLAAIAKFSKILARAQRKVFNPDGIRVAQFNGEAAGQSVFYYHQHLIPAYKNKELAKHASQAVAFEILQEQAAKLALAVQEEMQAQ
ncbi:MAG: HIT domain-containing protein [Cardiobacteriaceae bacterium]|nr:HIT domain-containing protein [Cardiobacteriaceae bacterium]